MAFKTFCIDGLCVHQFVRHRTVAVVAIGTFHFAFPQWMVRLPHPLRSDGFMALGAGLPLVFPDQVVRIVFVDIMATGTGEVSTLMFAAAPQRLPAIGMAAQADSTLFIRRTC
jgi:hypothetical protein